LVFWAEFSHCGKKKKKKKSSVNITKAFFGEKSREKSRHFLMKNCHMLPYLDNEFLEVARTSEDSLKKFIII
jgi:hypothetical protein